MTNEAFAAGSRAGLGTAQILEIRGEEARAFAQAQLSCDVRALQSSRWQWAAWLDHKGGVRALMHLAWLGDDESGNGRLLALLRGGNAESTRAELRRYVLRAKARIEAVSGLCASIGPSLPLGALQQQGDGIGFGYGGHSLWLESVASPPYPEREQAFRLAEIRAGWPRLPPGCEGEFLPPALGLEHLGAVCFDKGCYPGQEVAARLHYRGGHKLRLAHVASPLPLKPGDNLPANWGRSWILDAVEAEDGYQALVVLDEIKSFEYNTIEDTITVISKFDA